jgi:hypothetical protein
MSFGPSGWGRPWQYVNHPRRRATTASTRSSVAVARFKDGSASGSPTVSVVGQFKSEMLARRAAKAARQAPNLTVIGFPIRIR